MRDGKPYPPDSLAEVEILPGVREALQSLHDANYLLVVISNQPDVARGNIKRENVELINTFLSSQLPIDYFKTCYHDDVDNCSCRKPLPGALLEAAKAYNINLSKSFMVGDRWRDVEAGESAGCRTFFINYNYLEKKPDMPNYIVYSLADVKKIILEEL